MHFMTRLTLSTPFVLVLIEYLSFLLSVIGNPDVPPFWQNHAFREGLFAAVICAVILNWLWSVKVTEGKIALTGILGAPLVFGFWIATWWVGFGDPTGFEPTYLINVVKTVTFLVGMLMALTQTGKKKK